MYGGLLCSSYLVVYGISSLLFSHPVHRLEREDPPRTWTDSVRAPIRLDDLSGSSRRMAKELGLTGRIPSTPKAQPNGGFEFEVVRPGARSSVRVDTNGVAAITTTRRGLTAVLKGLHDARQYPDSFALSMWWNFTHVTVAVLLFSTLSGLWLWIGTRRFPTTGWLLFGGGAVMCLALIGWLMA
ncbi:MAG: hypothetical protein ABMA00_07350 [Gemmatimonas sp.]